LRRKTTAVQDSGQLGRRLNDQDASESGERVADDGDPCRRAAPDFEGFDEVWENGCFYRQLSGHDRSDS
jgi:hypothetical protein